MSEAGADVARVAKPPAGLVVDAELQCTDRVRMAALIEMPPADHDLLRVPQRVLIQV